MEFRHTPLECHTDQIRLLRVAPFLKSQSRTRWPLTKFKSEYSDDELFMVKCTMVHVDFHRLPEVEYNALSYTWGPSTPIRTIRVNGKPLNISENLWQFLHVAAQNPEIYSISLWVDQICIDQSSINERNHQVSVMGQIYRQASTVLIWLGPAGQNSDLAMKMLADGKVLAQAGKRPNWYDDSRGYPQIAKESFWKPLLSLLQRPYWCRVWIVQEVLLAKSVKILCGRMILPWDIFSQTIDKIYDGAAGRGYRLVQGVTLSDPVRALREARDLDTQRRDYGGPITGSISSNSRLSQLICSFRQSLCADPRDRVFGLLGLVGRDEQVEVDYSVSPLRLYIDVLTRLSPPGEDPYYNIYHRDERYKGYFARSLYRAVVDRSFDVGDKVKPFFLPRDACRTLCDIIKGSVRLHTLVEWMDDPEWGQPCNGDNFTIFGENFEVNAARPEFTCDTIVQMLRYICSWLPRREEVLNWCATGASILGSERDDKFWIISDLKMKLSPDVRRGWRFVNEGKNQPRTYRRTERQGNKYVSVQQEPPEWLQLAD